MLEIFLYILQIIIYINLIIWLKSWYLGEV